MKANIFWQSIFSRDSDTIDDGLHCGKKFVML